MDVTNDAFEEQRIANVDLVSLRGKMFSFLERNHQLIAWCCHIEQLHYDNPKWHLQSIVYV